MNVDINTPSIKDEEFVSKINDEIGQIRSKANSLKLKMDKAVNQVLG